MLITTNQAKNDQYILKQGVDVIALTFVAKSLIYLL